MLHIVLQYLLPNLRIGAYPGDDCLLVDDGAGPYIAQWNHPEPQPTQAEIEAATPAALEWWARKQIKPVTARQMFRALDQLQLLDAIEAFVATQARPVQIDWSRSQEFQRENPTLAAGASAFGMSDAEVDAIFALAASL